MPILNEAWGLAKSKASETVDRMYATSYLRDRFESSGTVNPMASNTKFTKFRRKIRQAKAGRKAKNLREKNGTTPKFAVHTDAADKNAPNQAKQS